MNERISQISQCAPDVSGRRWQSLCRGCRSSLRHHVRVSAAIIRQPISAQDRHLAEVCKVRKGVLAEAVRIYLSDA
jgi:hypothetical protein